MSEESRQANHEAPTRERAAEIALRESEARLRAFFDSIPDPVFLKDRALRFVAVNAAMERALKRPASEVLGKTEEELVGRFDPAFADASARALKGETVIFEVWLARLDGERVCLRSSLAPVLDAEGQVAGVCGTAHDITGRRTAEERAEDTLAALRATLDASPDGILALSLDRRVMHVNAHFRELWGVPADAPLKTGDDTLGWISSQLSYPEAFVSLTRALDAKPELDNREVLELKDGRVVERTSFPQRKDGKVIGRVLHYRDITARRTAEEGRKANLAALLATLEASVDGVLAIDRAGHITHCNHRFLEMWGAPPGSLLTLDETIRWMLPLVVNPTEFLRGVRRIAENDELPSLDILELKDGRVFERSSQPQRIDGVVAGRVLHFRDITDRVKAERAIAEREAQYRALVEHSPDLIARFDRQGQLLYLSPSAARYGDFGASPLMGLRNAETGTPLTLSRRWLEAIDLVFRKGESVQLEFDLALPTGSYIFNGRFVAEADAQGEVKTVLSILRDVTDQRRTEQDYRTLFNEMLDGFAVCELVQDEQGRPADYRFVASNPAFEHLMGTSPVGRLGAEVAPGAPASLFETFVKVVQTGEPARLEAYLPHVDKHLSLLAFRPRHGLFATFVQDISARKQSEQALLESEARYRALFENNYTVMLLLEPTTGSIIDANPAACSFYGYDRDTLCGLRIADVDAAPVAQSLALLARAVEAPQRVLVKAKLTSGELRDVEMHAGPMKVHGLTMLCCIAHDVTERLRAEAELKRLSVAIEQTSEFIAISDPERHIEYVNPAFETLTGHARSDALGKPLDFLHVEPEEGLNAAALSLLSSTGRWVGSLKLRRRDGTAVEVEASLATLRDAQAKITGYVAVHRDTTEQKKLERALRQAQKMEALGTLAGGIAHDFNNILAAIMGFTTLAQNQLPEVHPARPDLAEVVTASQRARDLVRQILAFSRRTEQRRSPLQVSVLAKEALKLLRATLPATIEIRGELSPHDDYVLGDPTQVHQIVMNLCTNAAHAMREHGGVLTVTSEVLQVDRELAAGVSGLHEGAYVRLRVQDTGHGIDPAILERVFEPYFTTKPAGEGTGLGLPVVHGIVTQAGGAVAVTSAIGRGTTVDVFLPKHQQEGADSAPLSGAAPRGRGRILFVDDEPALARFGKQCLEGLGYEVVALTSSTDALDLFEDDARGFDLVVTDQTMPHLTGLALARELHELQPEVPILLCTGYSDAIPPDGARSLGVRQVLLKPLPPNELASAVAAALRLG